MTANRSYFYQQYDAISQFIKNGNYKYQKNCYYNCKICNRVHLEPQGSSGLKISFVNEYERCDDYFIVLGECVDQLYSYFNVVVNKLGKNEFKKLFYKLFLFMNNKNILLDICYIIGRFYILLNL
jgi:hypothetical protein